MLGGLIRLETKPLVRTQQLKPRSISPKKPPEKSPGRNHGCSNSAPSKSLVVPLPQGIQFFYAGICMVVVGKHFTFLLIVVLWEIPT